MKMKMKRWLLCVMVVLSVVLSSAMGARPSNMFYARTSRSNGGGSRPTNTKYGHGQQQQQQNQFRVPRPPAEWIGGRYGAQKRRVPTGSNPLHNRDFIHATPRHRC